MLVSKEDGLSPLDDISDSNVEKDNFRMGMCDFGGKLSFDIIPIAPQFFCTVGKNKTDGSRSEMPCCRPPGCGADTPLRIRDAHADFVFPMRVSPSSLIEV